MVIDRRNVVIGGEGARLKGKEFEFLLDTIFSTSFVYILIVFMAFL